MHSAEKGKVLFQFPLRLLIFIFLITAILASFTACSQYDLAYVILHDIDRARLFAAFEIHVILITYAILLFTGYIWIYRYVSRRPITVRFYIVLHHELVLLMILCGFVTVTAGTKLILLNGAILTSELVSTLQYTWYIYCISIFLYVASFVPRVYFTVLYSFRVDRDYFITNLIRYLHDVFFLATILRMLPGLLIGIGVVVLLGLSASFLSIALRNIIHVFRSESLAGDGTLSGAFESTVDGAASGRLFRVRTRSAEIMLLAASVFAVVGAQLIATGFKLLRPPN